MRNFRPTGRAALASLMFIAAALPAQANVFNPHLIISDDEIRRSDSMDYSAILSFLSARGTLAEKFDVDPMDGLLKNVPQIIDDAAKRYGVNPKYIISLMEKESSVVSATKPTKKQLDWATGYALCDGCRRKNATAVKNQGLAKQIDAGAGFIKWFFDNVDQMRGLSKPGVPQYLKQSKTTVTPINTATAALYSYTPHLQGNRLLWSIWNRWFGEGTNGLELADGTLVRSTKSGAVALMQGGKFRPITSRSVLTSRFNSRNIVDLNPYDFDSLQRTSMGRPISFADESLVKTEDGSIWLLIGNERRRFADPEAFRANGFNPEEVESAELADIEDYAVGDDITADSSGVTGKLLQDKTTGAVFYVTNGTKRPIWDKAILEADFPNRKPTMTAHETIAALKDGKPLGFYDGNLVRTKGTASVYVISGGKKRPIASEETFLAYGYDWDNVLVTIPAALDLHQLGAPLTLDAGLGNFNPPDADQATTDTVSPDATTDAAAPAATAPAVPAVTVNPWE